ncbi:MAG: imidazole glycerol phosphate synthase subunit HisH [Anaerolineae bacterium]|nr:imidazole glycerol phosphate synthase subunit HisH [Anaerolineae bacterium]
MIAIVDYGVGNLRSVQKALEQVGAAATVTSRAADLDAARGIVLPGVGAFGDGMASLRGRGLAAPVLAQAARGKPLLGICLGMQMLFEESEEMGQHAGLGLLRGKVVRFADPALKVPHVGWNQIEVRPHPLLAGIAPGAYAYFVHSYYVVPAEAGDVLATTEYGVEFASVVGRDRVWGAQFHPEKSQEVGLRILANFSRLVGALAGEEAGS